MKPKRFLAACLSFLLLFTPPTGTFASAAAAGPAECGISDYLPSWEAGEAEKPEFNRAVANAFAEMRKLGYGDSLNDVQKALLIHDWLITHSTYDYDGYVRQDCPIADFTAYGALVNGLSVCEGLAHAYALLMNSAGIPAITVASSSHAWNIVRIVGRWYHVDVTWDDPMVIGSGTYKNTGSLYHTYFLLSDQDIIAAGKADHASWKEDSGLYNTPECGDGTAFHKIIDAQENNRPYGLLNAFAGFLPAQTASVRLDTSRYSGEANGQYIFAVDSSIGELAFASSSDPSCVSVSRPNYRSGRQLYTIYLEKPGSAVVSVITASGKTASFPVSVSACAIRSDTTGTFYVRQGSTYQFLLTSKACPQFVAGSPCFSLVGASHSGDKWYFKVRATGRAGEGCGFYIGGGNSPTAIAMIR